MEYGYKKTLDHSFADTIVYLEKELKAEGFGILTQINVKETFKKKLDVDFDNYMIFGACNPPLAYEAIRAEFDVGLFLPYNIIVYEKDGQTFVAFIKPMVAMETVKNESVKKIAQMADERLKMVIDKL